MLWGPSWKRERRRLEPGEEKRDWEKIHNPNTAVRPNANLAGVASLFFPPSQACLLKVNSDRVTACIDQTHQSGRFHHKMLCFRRHHFRFHPSLIALPLISSLASTLSLPLPVSPVEVFWELSFFRQRARLRVPIIGHKAGPMSAQGSPGTLS